MENGPTPDTAAFIQRMEEVSKQIFRGIYISPFLNFSLKMLTFKYVCAERRVSFAELGKIKDF